MAGIKVKVSKTGYQYKTVAGAPTAFGYYIAENILLDKGVGTRPGASTALPGAFFYYAPPGGTRSQRVEIENTVANLLTGIGTALGGTGVTTVS